jgi:hypothetical protein
VLVLGAMADTNLVSENAMEGFFETCLPPVSAKVAESLFKVSKKREWVVVLNRSRRRLSSRLVEQTI